MITGETLQKGPMSHVAIDPTRARFPRCVVWTPIPFMSWLVPFVGHVGICREDGVILDFAGPHFVSVDDFAFGAVARYLPLDGSKIPSNVVPWDEALRKSTIEFQHKAYNLFTCNCHSFVARCLNNMAYDGRGEWNVVTLAAWVFFKGRWVDKRAILRSFSPFLVLVLLLCLLGGSTVFVVWLVYSLALTGWFIFGTYCVKSLIHH